MHYYKFNVASWAKDTSHLSIKEEGIYLRLINYYYDTEKPIPLKTHLVLRKLRVACESESVSLILEEFFTKTKKGWIHYHCDKLINEYQKMSDKNKKNAKLGKRPKNKDLIKPTGIPVGNPVESDSQATGIPNYKPITINQELETKERESATATRTKKFVKPTIEEIYSYMQERDYDSRDEAENFYDYWESVGWSRRNGKIKDWRATVRTWLKNAKPISTGEPEFVLDKCFRGIVTCD